MCTDALQALAACRCCCSHLGVLSEFGSTIQGRLAASAAGAHQYRQSDLKSLLSACSCVLFWLFVAVHAQYLQQEVDGLRDKLQDSVRQSSTLEAEVRLLKQQLAEAKADARLDKQQSEVKLQERQMELARQATLLEQATVRSRRAAEEVTVAQQDLSTAKQQLQRVELERDSAQQQLQSVHAEVRKLRAQHSESDQEVRQLKLQVQQQQEQERRLQEQLARERQQQQEEVAATRASIEQHRIELRRCAGGVAES